MREKEFQGCAKTLDLEFPIKPAFLAGDAIQNARDVKELGLDLFEKKLLMEGVFVLPLEE